MTLFGSLTLLLTTELLLLLLLMVASSSLAKQPKTLKYSASVCDQGKCWGQALDPDLVAATVRLVGTAPTTHLLVTFQGETDGCLVSALSSAGVATQLVMASHLWEALQLVPYTHPSQHLLVGDVQWITSTLIQVKKLYLSAKINAVKTHWFWVVRNLVFDVHPASVGSKDVFSRLPDPADNHTSVPEPLPASSSLFVRAMAEVEDVLFEGLQGILISLSRRGLTPAPPSGGVEKRVLVGGVEAAPGGGSWRLKLAAVWTTSGLQVFRPLWPTPTFNLQGRTLRINCLKKPTVFLFDEGDHLAEARGYAADVVREIQKRLNFTDALVPNTGFGAYRNGTWNGMVGDLLRGEADVSTMDFTPIWQRTLVIDFGLIYSTDNVVIISRAPGAFIKPLLLLEIFTPFVWACLLLAGVAAGVVVGGMLEARASLMGGERSRGIPTYCIAAIKIIVFQSSQVWPKWLGSRLVCGTVMFLAVVVGSIYSGSITAFLAIPFRSEPINSLEELLKREVVPAIRRLSSPYSFFLTENSGVLGERVRRIMVVFSGTEVSTWAFLRQVASGTYGFIDTASSAIGRSGQYERVGKPCLFHVGRNPVRMDLDAFAYPKNSPIKYQFDEVMRWMRSYGIIEHIKSGYYGKACTPTLTSDGPAAISLTQAQGAFYILGVGLMSAIAAVVIEVIIHPITRNK